MRAQSSDNKCMLSNDKDKAPGLPQQLFSEFNLSWQPPYKGWGWEYGQMPTMKYRMWLLLNLVLSRQMWSCRDILDCNYNCVIYYPWYQNYLWPVHRNIPRSSFFRFPQQRYILCRNLACIRCTQSPKTLLSMDCQWVNKVVLIIRAQRFVAKILFLGVGAKFLGMSASIFIHHVIAISTVRALEAKSLHCKGLPQQHVAI